MVWKQLCSLSLCWPELCWTQFQSRGICSKDICPQGIESVPDFINISICKTTKFNTASHSYPHSHFSFSNRLTNQEVKNLWNIFCSLGNSWTDSRLTVDLCLNIGKVEPISTLSNLKLREHEQLSREGSSTPGPALQDAIKTDTHENDCVSWVWWHMPESLSLWRQGQKFQEFKVILDYTVSLRSLSQNATPVM